MKNKKTVNEMIITEPDQPLDLEHQATAKRPKVQTRDPFTTDELKSIYEYEHSTTAVPKKLEGKENGVLTQGELVYVNDSSLLTNKTGGAEGLIEVNESIQNILESKQSIDNIEAQKEDLSQILKVEYKDSTTPD